MQRDCIDHFDTIDCQASVDFCNSELSTGYWASGTSSGLLLFIVSPSRPAFFHRAERVRYFKGSGIRYVVRPYISTTENRIFYL